MRFLQGQGAFAMVLQHCKFDSIQGVMTFDNSKIVYIGVWEKNGGRGFYFEGFKWERNRMCVFMFLCTMVEISSDCHGQRVPFNP
jgi:hypothetical protein